MHRIIFIRMNLGLCLHYKSTDYVLAVPTEKSFELLKLTPQKSKLMKKQLLIVSLYIHPFLQGRDE